MEYRVFCLAMAFVGKKQQTVDANMSRLGTIGRHYNGEAR